MIDAQFSRATARFRDSLLSEKNNRKVEESTSFPLLQNERNFQLHHLA